jgi:hypothetical protein
MSETIQTNGSEPQTQTDAPVKRRRSGKRSPSVAKPAFVILQMLDDSGQPTVVDKRKVRIVAVERNAEKVMEAMESGEHANAFYLRIMLPPGSRAGSPNRPKTD